MIPVKMQKPTPIANMIEPILNVSISFVPEIGKIIIMNPIIIIIENEEEAVINTQLNARLFAS